MTGQAVLRATVWALTLMVMPRQSKERWRSSFVARSKLTKSSVCYSKPLAIPLTASLCACQSQLPLLDTLVVVAEAKWSVVAGAGKALPTERELANLI